MTELQEQLKQQTAEMVAYLTARWSEEADLAHQAEATDLAPWLDIIDATLNQGDFPAETRRAISRYVVATLRPAQTLRDLTAKKMLLTDILEEMDYVARRGGYDARGPQRIRMLVLPYAGRDDFDRGWLP